MMMDMNEANHKLREAYKVFKVLQQNASSITAQLCLHAEANTVRHDYATGCESMHLGYYNPSPVIDLIIGGCRRGRLLKKKPKSGKYVWEYALDTHGRILRANREYYIYQQNFIYTYTLCDSYNGDYFGTITRSTYKNTKLIRFEQITGDTLSCEEYFYECNHLANVHMYDYSYFNNDILMAVQQFNKNTTDNEILRMSRYAISCLHDGTIESITCIDHMGRETNEIVYTIPKKAQSLKVIEDRLMTRMTAAIPEAISKCGIIEPAYTIIIDYDLEHDPMPPLLAVGTESELTRLKESFGSFVYSIFSGPDMESFWIDVLSDDEEFNGLCREWNERVQELGAYERTNKFMLKLCRKMQQYDWSSIMKVTDQFVVITTDLHMVNIEKNLKALISKKKLEALGIVMHSQE